MSHEKLQFSDLDLNSLDSHLADAIKRMFGYNEQMSPEDIKQMILLTKGILLTREIFKNNNSLFYDTCKNFFEDFNKIRQKYNLENKIRDFSDFSGISIFGPLGLDNEYLNKPLSELSSLGFNVRIIGELKKYCKGSDTFEGLVRGIRNNWQLLLQISNFGSKSLLNLLVYMHTNGMLSQEIWIVFMQSMIIHCSDNEGEIKNNLKNILNNPLFMANVLNRMNLELTEKYSTLYRIVVFYNSYKNG